MAQRIALGVERHHRIHVHDRQREESRENTNDGVALSAH
jgi:hypothetical protein